jgi:hypothetical protein
MQPMVRQNNSAVVTRGCTSGGKNACQTARAKKHKGPVRLAVAAGKRAEGALAKKRKGRADAEDEVDDLDAKMRGQRRREKKMGFRGE